MLSKLLVFGVAVILSAPICAAVSGSNPAGGNSAGASAGGHSDRANGGGGDKRHGAASGSVAHGGGFNEHAAASRADISHADAMHATHLASGKHAEAERTSSKSSCMGGQCYLNRREPTHSPVYPINQQPLHICMTGARVWWDCGAPTKSR